MRKKIWINICDPITNETISKKNVYWFRCYEGKSNNKQTKWLEMGTHKKLFIQHNRFKPMCRHLIILWLLCLLLLSLSLMPSLPLLLLMLFKLDLLEYPVNKNRFLTEYSTQYVQTFESIQCWCLFTWQIKKKLAWKEKYCIITSVCHWIVVSAVHLNWESKNKSEHTHVVRITCRCSNCGDTFSPNVIRLYIYFCCACFRFYSPQTWHFISYCFI